jgi:hypothetical protein
LSGIWLARPFKAVSGVGMSGFLRSIHIGHLPSALNLGTMPASAQVR